jgi:hypothetical protein
MEKLIVFFSHPDLISHFNLMKLLTAKSFSSIILKRQMGQKFVQMTIRITISRYCTLITINVPYLFCKCGGIL